MVEYFDNTKNSCGMMFLVIFLKRFLAFLNCLIVAYLVQNETCSTIATGTGHCNPKLACSCFLSSGGKCYSSKCV